MRDTESNGYAWLKEPQTLSFIAVAALSRPPLIWVKGEAFMNADSVETMKDKVRTMLGVGLENGHDAIVLGAFGCGAFRCPPKHVAQVFAQVMEEEEYKGKYKVVSFAILDDHNAFHDHNPQGNFVPFQNQFKNKL
jgi:uncharacterized protein (TIGR02452 family)